MDAGEVARGVERHLGRAVFVSPSLATRIIEAWIEPLRPGWHVQLRASDADGIPFGHRELTSPDESCTSLNRSIVIALGLLAQSANEATPDDTGPPESTQQPPPARAPTPVVNEKESGSARPSRRGLDGQFGPAVAFGWGMLPAPEVGIAMRATIALSPRWVLELGSQLWNPQVASVGPASGSFSRSDVALGACPFLLRTAASKVGVCAGVIGGAIAASGVGSAGADIARRPAILGYGRAVGLLRISSVAWITGAATLGVNAARWTFFHRTSDGSQIDVWSMPLLSGSAEIGLVFHFGP
jgi:hypothetical protein